jgi:hypothetical protein
MQGLDRLIAGLLHFNDIVQVRRCWPAAVA